MAGVICPPRAGTPSRFDGGAPPRSFARRRIGIMPMSEEGMSAVIHELRIYHCCPGRLPALLKRFETATLDIWKRHGIRQAGFWTVLVGDSNNDLYYLLEWTSLAEREAKWTAFLNDPEWAAKRAESEKDGPILTHVSNLILQPTAFSSVR
jgi:hypothetical protein